MTLEVVDSDGRRCPTATDRVTVRLDGPADLLAMDNGDPTDLEPFAQANRRAFAGLALAIVRSRDGQPGRVTVTASTGRLMPGRVVVELDDGPRRRGASRFGLRLRR